MPAACVYARISNKSMQGDNFSITTQLQLMRDYMEREGYEVIELYDQGSAFTDGMSREKLKEALALAEAKKIDAFMFFSADRFTRRMVDGVYLRQTLYDYGVRLMCFYPHPHEITDEQEILHIFEDWRNQETVKVQRDKSVQALKTKAKMGLYTQGNIPYGYRLEGKKQDTRVLIHEGEAEVVRRIFRMYLYEHTPVTEIADTLNAEHIKARKGDWSHNAVRRIMGNETYTGTWFAFTWKRIREDGAYKYVKRPKEERIEVAIPAIIDVPLFEAVKERLHTRHHGRVESRKYLLSGRLSCLCGLAIAGQRENNGITPKDYLYYRCTSVSRRKGGCGLKKFHVEAVDETVWQFALEFIQEPDRLIRAYREVQEEGVDILGAVERQIATIQISLKEQEEELSSIIDQRAKAKAQSLKDMLDERAEQYAHVIDDMNERLELLRSEKDRMPFSTANIEEAVREVEALREMYEALHAINETPDYEAKRALIDILDIRVTLRIDEENQRWVDIHWLRKVENRKLWTQIRKDRAA